MSVQGEGTLADPARLAALRRTALLDAPAEEAFDRLTRLASRLLGAPAALVSLVDDHRQFFASCVGLPEPWASMRQTPLSHSFCQHVVTSGAPLVISDARGDPRVRDNLAIRDLGVIAYAGVPLETPDGKVLGSFCVIDREPRAWRADEIETLLDLAGAAATAIALGLDIADRRDAERALRESEQRTAAIVRSALDCIVTIDEEGHVVEFNPAAEQVFGYPRERVLGRPMVDLMVPPAMREAHVRGLAHYRETGEGALLRRRVETTAVRHDGSEFPIELAITPIGFADGHELFTAHLRDITDRRRVQEELVAAKRAAEESAHAKRQFLANVSHEIRTPLNAVIGTAHLLAATELTPEQSGYLKTLEFSAEILLALVNDVLDFSRIDAGHVAFDPASFDLPQLLSRLVATLGFSAESKGLALRLAIAPEAPRMVVADPARLTQVLLNLIGNAIKFTERGAVDVSVDVPEREPGRATLRFRVRDTGIGIAADKLDTIFEEFAQERADTGVRFGGTGLGLAIVRQLLERQGGSVTVQSEQGKGSCFTAELPVAIPAAVREERVEPERGASRLDGVRVLLAEDNPVNQVIASRILRAAGAVVEVAGDGAAAVERLRASPFDVVLMDLQMPVMDGFEAARQIRHALGLGRDRLPILALTASALQDDREEAERCGMDGVLVKPFHPADLLARVAAAVAGSVEHDGEAMVDLAVLERITLGQRDFALDVIEAFLRTAPEDLRALERATSAADGAAVRAVAHKLRSCAAMVGARRLERVLGTIETQAAGGDGGAGLLELVREAVRLGGATVEVLRRARPRYVAGDATGLTRAEVG